MNPFEIFSSVFVLICGLFGAICAFIFILIAYLDRQFRTITKLLLLNSIVAGFSVNIVCTSQAFYQLIVNEKDSLCEFRAFLSDATCGLFYHSFCLQAFYRLLTTIQFDKRYLKSKSVIFTIVIIQWLISFTFALPILLQHRFIYSADGHICQVSMLDIFGFLYLSSWVYLVPLVIIILIYIRIVFYIKTNSLATNIRRNLFEQQRLFRLIIIPILILFLMYFPSVLLFVLIKIQVISMPIYTSRICLIFISFGQCSSILFCLLTTDDIRKSLSNCMKKIKRRRRRQQQRRIQCIDIPIHRVCTL